MKYIVDRLREYNEPPFDYIAHEAAAKIEYLNRELDEACKEIFRIRRYRSEILEEAALEAAHEIEQLRTQSRMYYNKYWDTAKEFDTMRRGLWCIADSDEVGVPNYVRQFARALLGDTNE